MSLRNRKLEKNLRRRARAKLRRSREDWAEYKRYRRWWHYRLPPWVGRIIFPTVLIPFALVKFSKLDSFVGVVVFWAIASLMLRTGQLLIQLRSSPRLPVLTHLPISGEQAFTFLWSSYLRTSLWTLYDFAVIYLVVAVKARYGGNAIWMALAMAAAQWVGTIAIVVCLVAFVRRVVFYRAWWIIIIPFAALLIVGPPVTTLADSLGTVGYWLPPTGWILYATGVSRETGLIGNLWPAFSMALMMLVLPRAYQRLRSGYALPEIVPAGETARGNVEVTRRRESDGEQPDPFASLKAAIRRREFLAGFDWKRARWIERITARWLTPSQRLAAEFLSGGKPQWTRDLVRFVLVLCGVAAAVCLIPKVFAAVPFLYIVPLFFFRNRAITKGLPGMGIRRVGGSDSAVHSVYPFGFRQLAAVVIKATAVRVMILMLLLAMIGLALIATTGRAFTPTLLFSVSLGWKIATLIAAFHLILPIMTISPATNDGTRAPMIFLLILGVFALGASCLVLFLAEPPFNVAAAVFLIGGSAAALKTYEYAYNHNWFDLQRKADDKRVLQQ